MSFGKPGGGVCDDVEADEVRGRIIFSLSLHAVDICVGLGEWRHPGLLVV